jgi:UDP-N-acetylmuramoyl-L-alanyl-D-glutamate--2,6-diaminopimelate ligase
MSGAAPDAGIRPLRDLVARLTEEGRLVLVPGSAGSARITGVADDSRRVEPGNLFVAVPGLRVDGHEFAAEAVRRGAAAIVVEHPVDGLLPGIVEVVVDSGAKALASAAAWWFGDPSRELAVVGVTGTNGKTTTTFLAEAALEGVGWPTGVIGTIGIRIGSDLRRNEVPNTTPGALELQRLLREMVEAGERAAVIETSSHGLAAERVGSVAYDAAIFTNLSHEHLDFHGTFEAYRAAKLSLFERLPALAKDGRPGLGVVNLDDPAGPLFARATRTAGARVVGYGSGPAADVRLLSLEAGASTSRLVADAAGREIAIDLRLGGRFNARNALAVVGLAVGWDLDLEDVAAGLASLEGVPGRLEAVIRGQPFDVVVDYAHTSASLDAVARELHELVAPHGGRVLAVFGASGERDVGKRPLMGEAAARWSHLVIVTEDDSRNEDPASIYEAVAAGAELAGKRRGDDLLVIADRRAAIAEAFDRARPGDVVLIAGKGHETWNVGPRGPEPWSDRVVAEELLAERGFDERSR